ncbi:MAG: GtrA family protein [Treponemataceae bacterium]|nr:GtrA family protein [Treponemataceae bacterium]
MNVLRTLCQVLIYTSVGGTATAIDWGIFALLTFVLNVHYLLAAAIAFVISTFANWLLGRLILFRNAPRRDSLLVELLKVYATTLVGLLLNLLIMWVAVERFGLHKMAAKVIATGIVFFWNFSVRKFVIYKI